MRRPQLATQRLRQSEAQQRRAAQEREAARKRQQADRNASNAKARAADTSPEQLKDGPQATTAASEDQPGQAQFFEAEMTSLYPAWQGRSDPRRPEAIAAYQAWRAACRAGTTVGHDNPLGPPELA